MVDYQVFISYRRDGGEHLAGRISDKLSERGYKVFYDVESMRSGKFNVQLLDAIDSSEDFLLILPPNGLDRCVNEDDWVRKEIVHALKNNKNIIPIMMRNFEFPAVLPPQIDEIRKYEAVGASSEFFDAVIDRIENMLISSRQKGNILLNTAIKFINSSIYDQAMPILEKEILNNPSNDKLYFYMAVCKLGGRRPFVLVKSEIDKIENNISTALALSEKAIYYYFLAYIKFDYHSNKFLKASPDYRQLLTMALNQGITNEETDFLFSLLKTQKPSGF